MKQSLNCSETVGPVDARTKRVLVISATFPSQTDPSRGNFVKERVKAVAALPHFDIRVIAPVPWCPPVTVFQRRYTQSNVPIEEVIEGLRVYHPRYFLPPKLGGYFHPALMYPCVRRCVDRMQCEFDFDVIDAHFVFPSGAVAARLGQRYGKPVVMTGRGEDILRFPTMPFKRGEIRKAIYNSSHCIALSEEIATAFRTHGADPQRISIIPNGVDCDRFHILEQDECRRKLGLPLDAKIVLSVGDRQERKGFHLLVEALPDIREHVPNAIVVIVGGPGRHGRDYTAQIEQRIRDLSLDGYIVLAGARPHHELPLWYNSADVFSLLSSREGSPNVLLEALACGVPAVATAVGGIRDELQDGRLGVGVAERSAAAAVPTLVEALSRRWDRHQVRTIMERRSWTQTSQDVSSVFQRVLSSKVCVAAAQAITE